MVEQTNMAAAQLRLDVDMPDQDVDMAGQDVDIDNLVIDAGVVCGVVLAYLCVCI